MIDIKLKVLLDKYRDGTATPEETADVDNWYLYLLKTSTLKDEEIPLVAMKQRIWENIHAERMPVRNNRNIYFIATAAAAVILILIIVRSIFTSSSSIQSDPVAIADFRSGKNNATLKLSNGLIIDLTHAKTGILASVNGVTISKSTNDQIVYK